MRAEDKRVDVEHDIDHVDQQRRLDRAHESETLLETGDDQAEEHGIIDVERTAHYQRTLGVVRAIFRGDVRALDDLHGFDHQELRAFLFLEEAVTGRDPALTHLVYAEDRKDLLEQALAVLYPTMARGLEPEVAELREQHDALVEQVVELREHLLSLEEAQDIDRQIEGKTAAKDEADEDADGEDAKDDDDDDDDDDATPAPRESIWSDPDGAPVFEFEVVLVDPGTRTIEMVREVRDALGVGIREAMQLVEQDPGSRVITQTVGREEAEVLKQRLERSGGTVEIRSLADQPPRKAPS